MSRLCIHAIVSGRVQGVFYRDSTQKQAKKLSITGWVKNCDNGTVELVANGEEQQINQLIEWLWKGPIAAKVTNVEWNKVPLEEFEDFSVRR